MANDNVFTVLTKYCESILLKWFNFSRVHYKGTKCLVLWLKLLAFCLSLRRPMFKPVIVYVGFLVGEMALGQVCLLSTSLSLAPVTICPISHHSHLFISYWWYRSLAIRSALKKSFEDTGFYNQRLELYCFICYTYNF